MKLKKLLSVAILLASALGVNAQGFKDITSEALINPSFELSAEGVEYTSTVSKTLTSLYGWTIPTPQEQSIANATSKEIGFTNNGQGGVNPSDGNFFFWCRKGWGNANGTLSTTTNTLEAGVYYVEFDYKLADYTNNNNYNNLGSAMNVSVNLGGTELVSTTLAKRGYAIANNSHNPGTDRYMIDAPWTKMGAMFELTEEGAATIVVTQNLKNSGRSDVCYDNFKLYRVYLDEADGTTAFPLDVTGYIANPSFEAGGASDNYSYHGWTVAKTGGEIDVRTSGTNVFGGNLDGLRIFNAWDGSSTNNKSISQVIKGLPIGNYKLTAYLGGYKGSTMKLFAGEYNVDVNMEEGASNQESNAVFAELSFTKKDLNDITIGVNSTVFYKADNFRLYYMGEDLQMYLDAYNEAKTAAQNAMNSDDYINVVGIEKTALQTELEKETPISKNEYTTAIVALQSATNAFTAAKVNYDALVNEIAYARTIGVSTIEAESAHNSTATSASVLAATHALKVLEYTTITAGYVHDITGSYISNWETTYSTTTGQRYNGGGEAYPDIWDENATPSANLTVTLPAGQYAIKVAGRGQVGTSQSVCVTIGENRIEVPFITKGDTGLGINLDGVTSFDAADAAGFANGNAGRGWEWRYITFSLTEESEVAIQISGKVVGQWISWDAFTLSCTEDTYNATSTEVAKAKLANTIQSATDLNTTENIGDGAFQIPTSAVNTINAAIEEAQGVHDAAESTLAKFEEATATLNSAIEEYKNVELNGPAADTRYALILNNNEGWDHDLKAVTYIANGRNDHGSYNIQYLTAQNANYAQAFIFTPAGESNTYYLSQIDNDGNERFVSTGVPHGGNTSQIRTVMDVEDALQVKVIATATDGIYNIYNTEANNYIGSQDAGFFTVNSHTNFNIVETSEATVSGSLAAGKYATRIFPFIPKELPEDVTVYEFGGTNGNYITLAEVETPTANVPYILYNETEETIDITLSGYGLATKDEYEVNNLTGTYAADETTVPAESYVLQTDEYGVQQFRTVETETGITMPYRAYLRVPAPGVKAFFFGGETTGIEAIDAITSGNVEAIYTVNGAKVNSLQKGMNIVKLSNGKVQKVLVK